MQLGRHILFAALALALSVSTVDAGRLDLNFLPPDLPPSNICNAAPELFDEDETQVSESEEPGPQVLDDSGRLEFLTSDIKRLRRKIPDDAFDFIMALITRKAELDPTYAGIEETLDRAETYVAAHRLDQLYNAGLIPDLAAQLTEMNWSQTVRLSRYFRDGIGVDQDRDFATNLIIDQAYLGNANALLEVLRMQLHDDEPDVWLLDLEETARLAFGGLVGKLNSGLCNRVERIAREYLDGDLLEPNPQLAFAWRKFAADMGGAKAAWRVVEHHLSATGVELDQSAVRHYLQQAVANGVVIMPENVDDLIASGAKTEEEIRRILGLNQAREGSSNRLSAVPYFELDVRIIATSIAEDSIYLQYLKEVADLPHPPAPILTELAKETLLRKGRWKAEQEAEALLRQATDLGDPQAALLLADILLRKPADTDRVEEAEALLIHAVESLGHPPAMKELDALYRCRLPDSPRLSEAKFWADAYRATGTEPVTASPTDLARFDPRYEPEAVAQIQSLAIAGHGKSAGDWLQLLQSDRTTSDDTLRYWAARVARSDTALEQYMSSEYELSLTAQERRNAIELFRRIYLDVGSSISLDLALTLIQDAGRDPVVASQIEQLLTNSARRGQGAAIRMLHRLTGRDAADIYRKFAADIEARGDFVAFVFAAPFVSDITFDRYMERAVALMNCNSKDVTELVEAFASRNRTEQALHWVKVGMAMEGGNSLFKLGLSDRQSQDFNRGVSIAHDTLHLPADSSDAFDHHRQLFLAQSDPAGPEFNPTSAAAHLATIFRSASRKEYIWAVQQYRNADLRVRKELDRVIDIKSALRRSAQRNDHVAQYELGLILRSLAKDQSDLKESLHWLSLAAETGNTKAMVDLAYSIGFGVGRDADPKLALIWLDRADSIAAGSSGEFRNIFRAMVSE